MSLTGDPDGPPERYGLSVVDLMTGLVACFGLLAGITAARASGRGRDVDTSLFDLALFNLNYPGTWYLNAGTVQGRTPRSAHPSIVPSQLYRTADGWIFVMCQKQKFWALLAAELGRPEWAADPRFADSCGPSGAARRTDAACSTPNSRATPRRAGWRSFLASCRSRRCTTSPRRSTTLSSPSAAASPTSPIRTGARRELLASPIRLSDAELPRRAAPALGADTDALLRGLGYSEERIAAAARARAPWVDEAAPLRAHRPGARGAHRLGQRRHRRNAAHGSRPVQEVPRQPLYRAPSAAPIARRRAHHPPAARRQHGRRGAGAFCVFPGARLGRGPAPLCHGDPFSHSNKRERIRAAGADLAALECRRGQEWIKLSGMRVPSRRRQRRSACSHVYLNIALAGLEKRLPRSSGVIYPQVEKALGVRITWIGHRIEATLLDETPGRAAAGQGRRARVARAALLLRRQRAPARAIRFAPRGGALRLRNAP